MSWFKSKEEKQAEAKIKFLVPQVRQILGESLKIINSTESIKTGIGRFETIKTLLQRLLKLCERRRGGASVPILAGRTAAVEFLLRGKPHIIRRILRGKLETGA